MRAAVDGADEVGAAVIASTLTTVAVFVPIVFVEGMAGQLFGDQALTVTISLLASLVVALTVAPDAGLARAASAPASDATSTASAAGRELTPGSLLARSTTASCARPLRRRGRDASALALAALRARARGACAAATPS